MRFSRVKISFLFFFFFFEGFDFVVNVGDGRKGGLLGF